MGASRVAPSSVTFLVKDNSLDDALSLNTMKSLFSNILAFSSSCMIMKEMDGQISRRLDFSSRQYEDCVAGSSLCPYMDLATVRTAEITYRSINHILFFIWWCGIDSLLCWDEIIPCKTWLD